MRDKIEVNLGEYKWVVGISTVTQPRPTVRTVTVGSFQQPTSHSNFFDNTARSAPAVSETSGQSQSHAGNLCRYYFRRFCSIQFQVIRPGPLFYTLQFSLSLSSVSC